MPPSAIPNLLERYCFLPQLTFNNRRSSSARTFRCAYYYTLNSKSKDNKQCTDSELQARRISLLIKAERSNSLKLAVKFDKCNRLAGKYF
jgi:hypothetical protein